MLEKSMYGDTNPIDAPSSKTSDRFKTKCIQCVKSAIYAANNNSIDLNMDNRKPEKVILLQCAMKMGFKTNEHNNPLDELESKFQSYDDSEFLMMLDQACNTIFGERYSYDDFENDLNIILKEGNINSRLHDGLLTPFNDDMIHSTIIEPCIDLLSTYKFDTADKNLKNAFELFRENNNEHALVECGKAIEAVLNKILEDLKLKPKSDKLNDKITCLKNSNILPSYIDEEYFDDLLQVIRRPYNIRNDVAHKSSVHNEIDDELVMFSISSTATTLVYLVSEYEKNHSA